MAADTAFAAEEAVLGGREYDNVRRGMLVDEPDLKCNDARLSGKDVRSREHEV